MYINTVYVCVTSSIFIHGQNTNVNCVGSIQIQNTITMWHLIMHIFVYIFSDNNIINNCYERYLLHFIHVHVHTVITAKRPKIALKYTQTKNTDPYNYNITIAKHKTVCTGKSPSFITYTVHK